MNDKEFKALLAKFPRHHLTQDGVEIIGLMCRDAAAVQLGQAYRVITEVATLIDQSNQRQAAMRERIEYLEATVGLLQNALAQSGQKFVLPADEHQPLSFTTTRRA